MNLDSLATALEKARIPPEKYLIGNHWDDRLCIERNELKGTWEVFFFDRQKGKLKIFHNEEAACYNLYAQLVDSAVMAGRLVPTPPQTD